MRLIPGKTKVQVELFKGVTLADLLVCGVTMIMIVFVLVSSLPGKLFITICMTGRGPGWRPEAICGDRRR